MKKLLDYVKQHKRLMAIAAALCALIVLAFILYGSKNKITHTSTSYNMSATEVKLTRILSEIDCVGKAEVMVNEGQSGIDGVIIVCEGANNLMTRIDLLNAVSTALNVDKNIIAIYAMNK